MCGKENSIDHRQAVYGKIKQCSEFELLMHSSCMYKLNIVPRTIWGLYNRTKPTKVKIIGVGRLNVAH